MVKIKFNIFKIRMLLYCLGSVLFLVGTIGWYLESCQEELHGQFGDQNQVLIVFDFDGTVCDSMNLMISKYNELSKIYRTKPIGQEQIRTMRDIPMQKFLETQGVNVWKLPIIKYKLSKALTPHIPSMISFQGMPETLVKLKNRGYKLGILTSNSYTNVELFLKKENLQIFDFVYCGSSLFGKARLLKKINGQTKPSKMFYVGDENRDIEAAHAANITSVAVTWGYQSEVLLSQYKPSYLVRTIHELFSIFQD